MASAQKHHGYDDSEALLSHGHTYHKSVPYRRQGLTGSLTLCLLVFSLAVNVLLLLLVILERSASLHLSRQSTPQSLVYSPAQEAVGYKVVVFDGGLDRNDAPYIGSSEQVDKNWEALYNDFGISQIPASQAARLPNATSPLVHDDGFHVTQLDVFHQLHCLNVVRKALYPDVYGTTTVVSRDTSSSMPTAPMTLRHVEHCYDQIRQAIMCASDISTLYWEWDEVRNRLFGNPRTTHVCRDFDRVRNWARAHRIRESLDSLEHVPGAPIKHD